MNIGDKVLCVNAYLSCLEEGKEYTVKAVVYVGEYAVILQEIPNTSFYPERFSKVLGND